MKDYVNNLLQAINEYDEDIFSTQERLRDLVCIISEKNIQNPDPLLSKLLYIASQKMRIFGYNHQNKFEGDPDPLVRPIDALKNDAIDKLYRSRIDSGKILDKTQKEIIDYYESLEIKRLLVSAPTSYGKTFLMREILYINRKKYNNVLLVFPTIALLRENATYMTCFVRGKKLGYKVIKSVDGSINPKERNIFVYTPERALQLLSVFPEIDLDFFFYDEVYKIDEGYYTDGELETNSLRKGSTHLDIFDSDRTRTFRICLYLLSKKVPEYYLAGPNLKKDDFDQGMKDYLVKNKIQVKEVLLEPTVRITARAFGAKIIEEHPLSGDVLFEADLGKSKDEKIKGIIKHIEKQGYGKTMLYCTTPAKANQYANALSENHKGKYAGSLRLSHFLEHIKSAYDIDGSAKKWSLVSVLEKGFAIHHGKLPRYVQSEILNQFNEGELNVLFCTTTIVEGVNTKAKNMVLLNQTKGRKQLTAFDVKNIGGRAGRYYHNFVGRIFFTENKILQITMGGLAKLNFTTYDVHELSGVDIDNAELEDLKTGNVVIKNERLKKQEKYKLPRPVFEKNRLVPYEYQEKLLSLFFNDRCFNRFMPLTKSYNPSKTFLERNVLNDVLEVFVEAGIVEDLGKRKYAAVGNNYYNNGFKGILEYEINQATSKGADVDKAYLSAFRTLKDIIEHKIPKIISLFESVFVYAAENRGYDMSKFSLSKATRFYETGVGSQFGEELVESGFPTDSVREIETHFRDFFDLDLDNGIKYYHDNVGKIHSLLDEYEKLLIEDAINEMSVRSKSSKR